MSVDVSPSCVSGIVLRVTLCTDLKSWDHCKSKYLVYFMLKTSLKTVIIIALFVTIIIINMLMYNQLNFSISNAVVKLSLLSLSLRWRWIVMALFVRNYNYKYSDVQTTLIF